MSEALKTPTLARLYLEQGHPHRARRIVNELLRQTPEDETLRELLAQANEAASRVVEKPEADEASDDAPADAAPTVTTTTVPVAARQAPAALPPESLRDRARELGVAVVDHLAGKATERLSRLLNRIRERRR